MTVGCMYAVYQGCLNASQSIYGSTGHSKHFSLSCGGEYIEILEKGFTFTNYGYSVSCIVDCPKNLGILEFRKTFIV
jgi:hypothetical protein